MKGISFFTHPLHDVGKVYRLALKFKFAAICCINLTAVTIKSSDILIVEGLLNPILKLIRKSVGLTNPKKHVIFKKPTFSKNPHFQKARPFKHSDVIRCNLTDYLIRFSTKPARDFQKTHIFKKPTFSKNPPRLSILT